MTTTAAITMAEADLTMAPEKKNEPAADLVATEPAVCMVPVVDILSPQIQTLAGVKTAPTSRAEWPAGPDNPVVPVQPGPPGLHRGIAAQAPDPEVEDLVNKLQPRITNYEYRRFNL